MNNIYTYEQPTNERIRALLRLEKLFDQYVFHDKHVTSWNWLVLIDSINELIAFTSRGDIKLEVLKELERQHSKLQRLSKRPQIDQGQLGQLLEKQTNLSNEMKSVSGQIGQNLHSVELLTAIRQKSSVPGCICDFDLPVYQHWLSQPDDIKQKQLDAWFEPFILLKKSVHLILDVLRHSVEETEEIATNSFYQQSLDANLGIQLIRISISNNQIYPEISAGKHRFSVRFMTNNEPSDRPDQYKETTNFKLQLCSI